MSNSGYTTLLHLYTIVLMLRSFTLYLSIVIGYVIIYSVDSINCKFIFSKYLTLSFLFYILKNLKLLRFVSCFKNEVIKMNKKYYNFQ